MKTKKSPMPGGITMRQAIELSGLTRQAIYSILVNGKVEYTKWENVYVIDRESFLEYLRQPRRGPRPRRLLPAR